MVKRCMVNTGSRVRPCIPKYSVEGIVNQHGAGFGGGRSRVNFSAASGGIGAMLEALVKGTPPVNTDHDDIIQSLDYEGNPHPFLKDDPVWKYYRLANPLFAFGAIVNAPDVIDVFMRNNHSRCGGICR